MGQVGEATLRRIRWRLLPFLGLLYVVSFLDRVNVSYAKLTMDRAIGIDDRVFALGAGIFFLGYFLFEVPSNLALHRFGARRWIARIMITWGLVSAATAFVTGGTGFVALRLVLGIAEAGFLPGILLYLTYWFPAAERGRVVGLFMAAVPLASVIGGPLSSELLGVDALGLAGWQWLFLLEGLPAVLLGLACLAWLPDGPRAAVWLPEPERLALAAALDADRDAIDRVRRYGVVEALIHPVVWALALAYFGIVLALYGLGFWLPTLIQGFGVAVTRTGWLGAMPFVCAALFMVWWGRRADHRGERLRHMMVPSALGCLGFVAASQNGPPALQLGFLCLAAMGIYGALPVFWTWPTRFLSGSAAAAGIALINALGNLAGYLGPEIVGWLKGGGTDFGPALWVLGLAMLVPGAVVAVLGWRKRAG